MIKRIQWYGIAVVCLMWASNGFGLSALQKGMDTFNRLTQTGTETLVTVAGLGGQAVGTVTKTALNAQNNVQNTIDDAQQQAKLNMQKSMQMSAPPVVQEQTQPDMQSGSQPVPTQVAQSMQLGAAQGKVGVQPGLGMQSLAAQDQVGVQGQPDTDDDDDDTPSAEEVQDQQQAEREVGSAASKIEQEQRNRLMQEINNAPAIEPA